MTEKIPPRDRQDGRLDLRALDLAPSAARAQEAVQAVLARLTPRADQPEWWGWISRMQRGLAAAAVVFVLLAGAVILSRRKAEPVADLGALVEAWVASGQVPTNGELLAAYMGYRQ